MRLTVLVLGTFLLACLPLAANADWMDGFESYAVGSGLHGQGGWEAWDLDPTFDAYVGDMYAHTGNNSAGIIPTSDIVHQYMGYTSGVWEYVAWVYLPSNFTGQSYFIMLNTYEPAGTNNWSVQNSFHDGIFEADPGGESLPWILGQWVEIKLVIDLDTDVQTCYYGGSLLYQKSWAEGMSGGGVLNIGAVDLFGNGAETVYYDDMSLTPEGATAVEPTSWGKIKSSFR